MKHHSTQFPYFIETGTLNAETTRAMVPFFNKVITIELSPEYYWSNVRMYARHYPTIQFFQGDSTVELVRILPGIDQPALFFLDGHWSSGDTARGSMDCPLVEELEAIMRHMRPACIIIVDDFRLFGTHLSENWTDITKDRLLTIVASRLISEYHLPSLLNVRDRWVLELKDVNV